MIQNSAGTDHGWGGHAVVLGGAVVDTSWPAGVRLQSREEFLKGRVLVSDLEVLLPDESLGVYWLNKIFEEDSGNDFLDIFGLHLWLKSREYPYYSGSKFILQFRIKSDFEFYEHSERVGVRHLHILLSHIAIRRYS
jgi:hypothetical protein